MSARKTIGFFVVLLILLIFFPVENQAARKNKKVVILINGLLGYNLKAGSDNDYIPGENDFPMTPAYTGLGLGCGLMFNLSDRIALRVTGDYILGSEVEKKDPSDDETVKYRTYDSINILGGMIYRFGIKQRFFASGGAGFNILNPYADKEAEGSLGSVVIISAPDSKINLMASIGGGIIFPLKKSILKIEALFNLIFETGKNSILLRMGIGF
jgi:hypothetical protein